MNVRGRSLPLSRVGCVAGALAATLAVPCFIAHAQRNGKSGSGKPGSGAAQYSVSDLAVMDDAGATTVIRRVNASGEVAGGSKSKSSDEASSGFLLSAAGGYQSIGDQQLSDFVACYGVNDAGEVAGVVNAPAAALPFRAVRKAGFQLLPLLGGDSTGFAYGINSAGEAVGFSGGAHGVRAVWWTRDGSPTALASLAGTQMTKAVHINAKGDIVGFAGDSDTTAVLWPNKGGILPLGTLSGYTSSQAESIGDKGDIAGWSSAYDTAAVRMHAVLWNAGSLTPQDLGTLAGGTTSRARDVDSSGNVVGTSSSAAGNHAFLWTSATGMQDMNALSGDPSLVLIDALSITKQGVILAIAISKSDFPPGDPQQVEEHELPRHIVLLTPSQASTSN